jgi:hypothetical protein
VPDLASVYTLTTPGTDISFNDFELFTEEDGYWLNDIQGLDDADLRVPRFNKPVTHGTRILPGFFTGLAPAFVGEYVVQSTVVMDEIRAIRNTMRRNLRDALRAIIDADGTLAWSEPVVGDTIACSLTVRYVEKLTTGFESNFAQKTFAFSLASEASIPSEA